MLRSDTCLLTESREVTKKKKENLNLFNSRNHEQTYEPRIVILTVLQITSLP